MKIYISGKISGLPFDEVKLKFEKAETGLVAQGYEVVSPLKTGVPYPHDPWEFQAALNIILLIGCDAVFLLPDWEYSKASSLEKNIAERLGKKMIYAETPVFSDLKQAVADITGVSFCDITGKSRKRGIVYARMIYSHYCRKQDVTITKIASEMKKNHSTVIYYLKKYTDDYRYNPQFREIADRIEKTIIKH